MAQDVIFRRINGRIIPIRKKAETPGPGASGKADVKSIAALAAGTGLAVAAGRKAYNFEVDSAIFESVARNIKLERKLNPQMAFNFGKKAVPSTRTLLKKSAQFHQYRNFALIAGGVIAAPLIAMGISKLRDKPKDEHKKENLAAGFGIASTIATTEYYRRLINPSMTGVVETVKKAFNIAKSRSAIQMALKGI